MSATPTDVHEWGSAPDFYGPRHEYRESLMLRRLLPALPGPRLLNAGCGAGSLSLRAAEAGCRVSSLDESPGFVAHLRARVARERPGDEMPVVLGDVTCLPFDDRSFDGVVCGEVIEHIPDDVAALAEMRRVLVPGGVVLVSVPANPWRYDWFDRWAGHVRRYTPEALEGAFRAAGLVRPEAVGWGFPMTGLYHRHVFMPMLRRRLERAGEPPGAPSTRVRRLFPVVRAALELDTLLLGRAPGWFGLIGVARAPG